MELGWENQHKLMYHTYSMESLANNKPILKNLQEIIEVLNLGNSELDNRLTYLKVRKIFKEGTDNLTLDHKHGQKGLTDVIQAVKKGSTRYKEIVIDTKKIEIQPWTTIKERWNLDEEGEHSGHREKAFRYWKTGFLSAKLRYFM